jgi:hypothetical protein
MRVIAKTALNPSVHAYERATIVTAGARRGDQIGNPGGDESGHSVDGRNPIRTRVKEPDLRIAERIMYGRVLAWGPPELISSSLPGSLR